MGKGQVPTSGQGSPDDPGPYRLRRNGGHCHGAAPARPARGQVRNRRQTVQDRRLHRAQDGRVDQEAAVHIGDTHQDTLEAADGQVA